MGAINITDRLRSNSYQNSMSRIELGAFENKIHNQVAYHIENGDRDVIEFTIIQGMYRGEVKVHIYDSLFFEYIVVRDKYTNVENQCLSRILLSGFSKSMKLKNHLERYNHILKIEFIPC